jgi:hypothetical protein
MPDRSFGNVIIKRDVSLAIETFLIAPSTVTWSPTRIQSLANTALPTGFRLLGSVVEDSVTLTFTKELFQLQVGLPKILAYSAVIGISGRVEAQFNSFSQRVMAYAMGNVDPVNSFSTIYLTAGTSIIGLSDNTSLISNTPGFGGIIVGDVVITASSTTALLTTDNEAEVNSIGTGANTLILYFTSPGFPTKPETSWFFARLTMVALPAGTSKQKEYHIIGVADTIDGFQIIHDIQKARVGAGDMQDAMRPTENGRIQARWELFGYTTSRYLPDTELVVAEKFWFPKT